MVFIETVTAIEYFYCTQLLEVRLFSQNIGHDLCRVRIFGTALPSAVKLGSKRILSWWATLGATFPWDKIGQNISATRDHRERMV